MPSGFTPPPTPEIPFTPPEKEKDEKNAQNSEAIFPVEIEPTAEEIAERSVDDISTEIAPKIPKMHHAPQKPQKTLPPLPHDPIFKMVETIMAEGFEDVYKELPIREQQAFRIKGEKTAHAVRELLRETKVRVGKIFRLIYDWLRVLPGINLFFLEQEAKIKADKILALKYHDTDHWTHTS